MSKLLRSTHPDGSFHSWIFRCPGCETPHQCDGRWTFNGDEDKPTFDGSVLVKRTVGENHVEQVCHSFVKDGQIQFLDDCTHTLRGKTVPLPEWTKDSW